MDYNGTSNVSPVRASSVTDKLFYKTEYKTSKEQWSFIRFIKPASVSYLMVLTNVTRILPLCFQQAACLKSIFYCNCNSVYKIWFVSYDVTLKVTGLTFTCDHK